jgi:hypothetical protein
MVSAKRLALLLEQKEVSESLAKIENPQDVESELTDFVSFASDISLVFEVAEPQERRRILGLVTKARELRGREMVIELAPGFREIAARYSEDSQAKQDQTECLEILVNRLLELCCEKELPSQNAQTSR